MTDNLSRLLTASLVAPFLGAFIGVCVNSLWWVVTRGGLSFNAEGAAVSLLIFPIWALYVGAMFGLPAMLLLGVPAHMLLCRLRWLGIVAYAALGATAGLMALALIHAALYLSYGSWVNNWVDAVPIALFVGIATAVAFWVLRRPDRDLPNPLTSAS